MTVFWWYYAVYAGIFGLVIGSFCNVAIHRWPAGGSVVKPRSQCPRCGAGIRWYDNVPVLSWLWLRGRCRDCAAAISPAYPLIEALVGVLALLLYLRLVPDNTALDAGHAAAFAVYLGFIGAIVIGTYVDLRHYLLPDEVTLYAVPVGIAAMGLLDWLVYAGPLGVGVRESVLASFAAGGFFAAVAWVGHVILRREGLGWGDVKLMAMIGAFLGLYTWVALVVGTVTGAAVHLVHLLRTGRAAPLPYGPSLGFGALVALLWGDALLTAYFPGMALLFEVLRRPTLG